MIHSERSNFPTDLYIAEALARERGFDLVLVEPDELPARLDEGVVVLMLTHVNYRSARMHDMAALTRMAHAAGALTVWDLAHSAGAVPVDLHAAQADFAIGCGYKYLNGGPGAPAFVWAHPQGMPSASGSRWPVCQGHDLSRAGRAQAQACGRAVLHQKALPSAVSDSPR